MTESEKSEAGTRLTGLVRQLRPLLPAIGMVALFLVLWQEALEFFRVPAFLAPLPTSVVSLMLSPTIPWASNAWATLSEALGGFALAAVVGILIAMAIASSPWVQAVVEPLVLGAQLMPKIAFVPIFFVWFGLNYVPRVLTVFLLCLFPVVIDSAAGLTRARRDLIDLVRPFKPSRLTVMRKVLFPTALPDIFAGLKISVTISLLGAVVAEFVASSQGLGYLLLSGQQNLNTTLSFAAAAFLVLMGFVLFGVVAAIERVVVPWRRTS